MIGCQPILAYAQLIVCIFFDRVSVKENQLIPRIAVKYALTIFWILGLKSLTVQPLLDPR